MRQLLTEQGHFAGLEIGHLIPDKTQTVAPDRVVQLQLWMVMPGPAKILAFQVVHRIGLLQGSIDLIKVGLQITGFRT